MQWVALWSQVQLRTLKLDCIRFLLILKFIVLGGWYSKKIIPAKTGRSVRINKFLIISSDIVYCGVKEFLPGFDTCQ